MAVLFSATSQNWTAAGWKTVDATSYLKSEVAATTTSVTYTVTQTFTPGAITVEGILLRIKYIAISSGTFNVQLYNSTGAVAVTTVTCNVSDIPNTANLDGGWCYFKFSSPVTLLGSTAYSIRILSSVSGAVSVYRDAINNNWCRGLVTSTTASIANGDDAIICGNITAAATTSVNTITYDYTGANTWASLEVGAYGKMIGENSASKNYALTINSGGILRIAHNGIVELSTSSSRLPSTSTFTLTLTCATNGANYIDVRNFGTFRAFGATKIRKAKLAADLSVGGTSITTDVSTGWVTGDNIVLSNTDTQNGFQLRTLASNATGTSVPIVASTYATKGTAPTITDVINLTSNFKIQGSSIALCGGITSQVSSVIDIDNIEFQFMGGSSTTTNIGIYLGTTTPTTSIKDCSMWNMLSGGSNIGCIGSSATATSFTIDGCVLYPNFFSGSAIGLGTSAIGTVKNCVVINTGYGTGISLGLYTGTVFQDCVVANCTGTSTGVSVSNAYTNQVSPTINNIVVYWQYNGMSLGISTVPYHIWNTNLSNISIWRCNYSGININAYNVNIDTFTLFGNTNYNIFLGNCANVKLINGDIQSGVTKTCAYGIVSNLPNKISMVIERCNFGTVTKHTTADLSADNYYNDYLFSNCNFGSTTLLTNNANMTPTSKFAFQRFNGSSGSNRVYKKYGTVFSDTTIFDSSPSSQRLTPNNATYKLVSSPFQMAVANGTTATFSIKVRKSVVGDGTAYNGSQPRLILRSNPSAGSTYNSDIVCATASGSAGTWETLTYTLPAAVTDNIGMEFYVDCDGTTGWVNIDSITVS